MNTPLSTDQISKQNFLTETLKMMNSSKNKLMLSLATALLFATFNCQAGNAQYDTDEAVENKADRLEERADRIRETNEMMKENQEEAREARADELEDEADSIRDSAEEKADRLEEQADRVRESGY